MTELHSNQFGVCKCYMSMSLDEPFHDARICECDCHEREVFPN